ncbi:LysR family transcriptional regulator [Marinobacterium jannaschii]|uniref:LysR family transcriptional regulator n=1 Tax=Marinobacterium jannaschii TaxID=64970 RepID=UPI000A0032F7|nr:LysR family transcriptional regulator [Marinobacterium jannaschii]
MDLIKSLRIFTKVVEHQSFSAAARELNMVTSAVSRHVTELEQHYNCRLLARTTRSMRLTEEGRHYLTAFDALLRDVDALEQESQQRLHAISGQIRISAPLHIGHFGLQSLLSDFLCRHPAVKVSWLLLNRYVNLVEEGIDLAVRVGHLPDSSLIAHTLGKMALHFVASPAYLAAYGEPQHPRELRDHRCILDSGNRQPGRFSYQEAGRVQHISVSGAAEVNNGEAVARFAADGVGIAQLPDFLVSPLLAEGKLQILLKDYEPAPIPVSLVYPGNRLLSPALKALIEEIRNRSRQQSLFTSAVPDQL